MERMMLVWVVSKLDVVERLRLPAPDLLDRDEPLVSLALAKTGLTSSDSTSNSRS